MKNPVTLLALLLVLVIALTSFVEVEGFYLSTASNSRLAPLKRSDTEFASRRKRYTDYQERASAFCTGLCMFEERKSYSECFDLCNFY